MTIISEITMTLNTRMGWEFSTCNLNHWILLPNWWKKGFQIITVSSWQPLSTVVILTTIWYLLISAYSILHTISNRHNVDDFELLNSVNFALSNLVSYGQNMQKQQRCESIKRSKRSMELFIQWLLLVHFSWHSWTHCGLKLYLNTLVSLIQSMAW